MFVVEMLPAGHGDSLVVEWGPAAAPTRLLIDAGTQHSWDEVRGRLLDRRSDRYEFFTITHVDEDHIGGAIKLLEDGDLRHRIDAVWFNGFIHCDAPRMEREQGPLPNVLGPVHGEQLTDRIHRNGLDWNPGFAWGTFGESLNLEVGGPVMVPDEGDLPTVDLPNDARLILLSPTAKKLERMAKEWKRVVERVGLVPGSGDSGFNRAPSPFERDVDEIDGPLTVEHLETMDDKRGSDGSEANGSSIAFIIEHDGRRLLLSGDAHGSVLRKGLKRYAEMIDEVDPRIDLVKLPHHGSGANFTKTLAKSLNADRFLVSTNADNFGHPNDAALARAILFNDRPVTFYCNYRSARTDYWAERAPDVGANVAVPDDDAPGIRVAV